VRRGSGALLPLASLFAAACASAATPRLEIPRCTDSVVVDGILDEPCHRQAPTLERFVVAREPGRAAPATKAWLSWSEERLVLAFECEDADLVAAPESGREHDVDGQDRVELFLWSGRADDSYACIEVGARGAVHDYRARFYRRFDDAWKPAGFDHAVTITATGYRVEASLSRAALAELGFDLAPGATFRAGLFRADFRSGAPDSPTWITWIDAGLPQPDFHVAESFGEVVLAGGIRSAPQSGLR